MDNLHLSTPASKKIRINEITSSLSSSKGVPTKRAMPMKRGHSEISDNSPVQTAKLPRVDLTPTNSSLNDSGKENEASHSDDTRSKSPISGDIFSTCIPHHYHSLQDHEKDEEKAFARVKRLLTAISSAKSKPIEPTLKSKPSTSGQIPSSNQPICPTSRPSITTVPSASLTCLTTTTTVTTTPRPSIGQPASSLSLDKSTPTSAASSQPLTSTVPSINNSVAPVSTGPAASIFTFGQSSDKPTFNFSATITPSQAPQATPQTNVVTFNSSTPASTLNHLSTLAGNMVGSPGTFSLSARRRVEVTNLVLDHQDADVEMYHATRTFFWLFLLTN